MLMQSSHLENVRVSNCASKLRSGSFSCGQKVLQYWCQFIGLVKKFVGQTESYGCPVPCKQTTYGLNLNYFHKNSWIDTEDVPGSKMILL